MKILFVDYDSEEIIFEYDFEERVRDNNKLSSSHTDHIDELVLIAEYNTLLHTPEGTIHRLDDKTYSIISTPEVNINESEVVFYVADTAEKSKKKKRRRIGK